MIVLELAAEEADILAKVVRHGFTMISFGGFQTAREGCLAGEIEDRLLAKIRESYTRETIRLTINTR